MDVRDKFAGVVLGTAIGDALGYPVEFLDFAGIVKKYGPTGVQDLAVSGQDSCGRACALYSDDTQMFRAVCEGLMRAGPDASLDQAAEEIAEEFVAWAFGPENNRAPGNACMEGARQLELGTPWRLAGKLDGGGCGAAMRSMAYGLWFWRDPDKAAHWAGEHALMTHRSKMAQASAAAVAAGVAAGLLSGHWDVVVDWMIASAEKYDHGTAQMLHQAQVDAATLKGDEAVKVLDRWRGWRGDEAVAASLYCALAARDYRVAVVLAVNGPGDSDSLGAITGALVGAVNGAYRSGAPVGGEDNGDRRLGIPQEWIGRIERADELVALASRLYKAEYTVRRSA